VERSRLPVPSLYGYQEKARRGYNPKRGRPSYHPLVCFEGQTRDFWHSDLRVGHVHTASGTIWLLRACFAKLPATKLDPENVGPLRLTNPLPLSSLSLSSEQIHLDEPSLFRKIFKPVGACSADIRARLLFPGHFVPAPFFNEGTSLIGT
jgi:hypothetical protein